MDIELLREELEATKGVGSGTVACRLWNTLNGVVSELESLEAQLAAERERNRWIPVGEKLPNHSNTVRIIINDGSKEFEWIGSYEDGRWIGLGSGFSEVTVVSWQEQYTPEATNADNN